MTLNGAGYSMRVFWSEGDGGIVALCPELDVSAFGDTYEEAVSELQVAIRLALEVYAADGEKPPAPAKAVSHSGQLRVRLPRSLHALLATQAEEEGVSLNTLIVSKLSAASAGDVSAIQRGVKQAEKTSRERKKHVAVELVTEPVRFHHLFGSPSVLAEVWRSCLQPVSPWEGSWWDQPVSQPLKIIHVPEEKRKDVQELVA